MAERRIIVKQGASGVWLAEVQEKKRWRWRWMVLPNGYFIPRGLSYESRDKAVNNALELLNNPDYLQDIGRPLPLTQRQRPTFERAVMYLEDEEHGDE